jgi:hypothetical protein
LGYPKKAQRENLCAFACFGNLQKNAHDIKMIQKMLQRADFPNNQGLAFDAAR